MQVASNLSLIPWIPIISLLVYCPVVCWLDWKYRDIGTHKIWLPLLAINIPALIAGYATNIYPWGLIPVTILISLFWLAVFTRWKRGADAWWLVWITMFAVINPLYNYIFVESFLVYLIIFTAAAYWAVWLDNRLVKHINGFEMENGIPFLIPISCAFIAAVVIV